MILAPPVKKPAETPLPAKRRVADRRQPAAQNRIPQAVAVVGGFGHGEWSRLLHHRLAPNRLTRLEVLAVPVTSPSDRAAVRRSALRICGLLIASRIRRAMT